MPIYSYRCPSCGYGFDEMKCYSDSDSPSVCPRCGEKAGRVFSGPAAVIYKGSGYYCTDNAHKGCPGCSECKGGN